MELDEQAFLEELFSLRRDATAAWECNAMGDFFSPACAGAAAMDCFPERHQPTRRRRKRLNDRLSMLRSVVPKISKMDRTSILGDTIDYMKELLERIRRLQEEMEEPHAGPAAAPLLSVFRELNPNEMLARNTPKFEVERKEEDTRVEIYCAAKPGLLLSTVSTLDTLGLDIQQCVVSCFNDFAMHASCSEMQREMISADAIKQELFKNAGYGGGCL
ncbi:Transcription factor bHLH93 [Triticum urartu]|uniref:Transcription factor bHLH93 n=1 Tax=Triticum urartu TaxID=4572 RepID=M7ZIK7_TRIUA|nr:Transcription factor bHLH93 [Triticum urartu]